MPSPLIPLALLTWLLALSVRINQVDLFRCWHDGKQLVLGQKWKQHRFHSSYSPPKYQYLGQGWTFDALSEITAISLHFLEISSINSLYTGVPPCYIIFMLSHKQRVKKRKSTWKCTNWPGSREPLAQTMQHTSCLKRCSTASGKLALDSRWPTLPEHTTCITVKSRSIQLDGMINPGAFWWFHAKASWRYYSERRDFWAVYM